MTREEKDIVSTLLDNPEKLSPKEQEFIDDLADRDDRFRDYRLTADQRDWLQDIVAKFDVVQM
ncbi:MAG: hypothetical protein AAF542_17970 [Pseudomonadota bacterium]